MNDPQITPQTHIPNGLGEELIIPRLTDADSPGTCNVVATKITYKDDPLYQARVARHLRRKSGRRANYLARSFGGEAYVLRAFAVFHRVLQTTKQGSNSGLTFRALLFLMIAKAWLVSAGKDSFAPHTVGKFSNRLLAANYSVRNPVVLSLELERLFFLNPLPTPIGGRTKYVLSMKARAFFRDLDTEFRRPFDITQLLHVGKL